jgi:lipopolysaccharide/colanic/teichoic acid biosynthesis glycosyltransferase
VHNAEAATGPVWAAKNDFRITPLGNFLRNTHLDELPQLINVLKGDMNLIGPRPERPEIAMKIERTIPEYKQRLAVRPGITGLAQMLAPADDPTDPLLRSVRRKMAFDLHYVQEMSFLLDVRIAIATPCHFLAAAITAVRAGVLRSHGTVAEGQLVAPILEEEAARSA